MDARDFKDILAEKLLMRGMPRHCGMCKRFNLCSKNDPERTCAWLKKNKAAISKFFVLYLILFLSLFCGSVFAETEAIDPTPPPVEIQFNLQNIPVVGGEAIIKLTVKALEDMHADISCLLPEGIEFVDNGSINLRSCGETIILDGEKPVIYFEAAELFVGPLEAGLTKEFLFSVRINNKGMYKLIARLQALAQWGAKEEILIIEAVN